MTSVDARPRRLRRALLRAVSLSALSLLLTPAGCKHGRGDEGDVVPAADVFVPPPRVVYHDLEQLAPDSFADVRFGVDDAAALRDGLALERHDVRPTRWGATGADVPVIEVRDARRTALTALILDPTDGTLRTVLVRDLHASPPPQPTAAELVPYLARFPGKIRVLGYAPQAEDADGTTPAPTAARQFWFVVGLGVKFGVLQESDGLWYLDHVEFFDPEWRAEELSAFKYGDRLVLLDTIGPAQRRQAGGADER